MSRPKEIQKPIRLSVVLSAEQAKQIERAAIEQSRTEGKRLTTSEMIRRACEVCYPLSKQMKFT